MHEIPSQQTIFAAASQLLSSGQNVNIDSVAGKLQIDTSSSLQRELQCWWLDLEAKVAFNIANKQSHSLELPDAVNQSMQQLWDHALKEARLVLELKSDQSSQQQDNDTNKNIANEDEIYLLRSQVEALDASTERLRSKLMEQENEIKNLTAERAMLKVNLQEAEKMSSNYESLAMGRKGETERAIKTSEETKRQLDERMKEEIARHQEASAKIKSQLSYYQNQLEKLRGSWGTKESALKRQLQELQSEIARNEVVQDTQRAQLRSLDNELKNYRNELASQSRNVSSSKSKVLSTTNKLKRFKDEVERCELEIKELKKRAILDKAEIARRETDMRLILKGRDEDANKMSVRINDLQRKLIAREEEVRRLTARL
jgi:chromosome segregation ATPase